MSAVRENATVFDLSGRACGSAKIPEVFSSPIRPDHVRYIHTQMAKNARQAYAVTPGAGYQTSAESWGTGRAVARIPRVSGGGTHRAGQAAFGNMCRGGGMYSPTKTYRRWHRKINLTEKRHAVASAIAASGVSALVSARGHNVDAVGEIPCVVSNAIEAIPKTKAAMDVLKKLGVSEELSRVVNSKTIRAGRGKARGRKYTQAKGPLIVYAGDKDVMRSFRAIPGVDLCHVSRLNLLDLAPGGTLGRFIIFSEGAISQLEEVYAAKSSYTMARSMCGAADIRRIINSTEVQSVLKPKKNTSQPKIRNYDPMTNKSRADKLAIKQI